MRVLARFAGGFSMAAALGACVLPERLRLPAGLLLLTAAVLLRLCRRKGLFLLCAGLAAGLLWTAGYQRVVRDPAGSLVGRRETVTGTVCGWPSERSGGQMVPVRLSCPKSPDPKIRLYLNGEPQPALRPGDQLEFTGEFRAADLLAGEPTRYYEARGVLLLADASVEDLHAVRPDRIPVRALPDFAVRELKRSAEQVFPADAAPLVTALMTGDKTALAGDLSLLRRAGLAHTVAVSGMHLSFLAGAVTLLLGRGRLRTAVVTTAALLFFTAMVGAPPSALRAAFLCIMLQLAVLTGRENDPPTTLLTALMLLLAANPWAAADLSLQLSFTAVAGIDLFSAPLTRRLTALLPTRPAVGPGRLFHRGACLVCASAALTLGALVFTVPLSACYFHSVALLAPISNLLCLWAVSLLFLGGILLSLLGLVLPGPAALAARLFLLPARWILWVSRTVARLPFASVPAETPYLLGWLVLTYGLLGLWMLCGCKGRIRLPVCCSAICLCAAVLLSTAGRSGVRLSLTALDVGYGQAAVLCSRGCTMVVDCGGSRVPDPGDVTADYLQSLGLNRLDVLVISGFQEGRSNGVERLLERLEVGRLILPDILPSQPRCQQLLELAEQYRVPVELLREDRITELGAARVSLLAPVGGGRADRLALSVLCSSDEFDVLLTGGQDAGMERRLLRYVDLPDIEVLVAGRCGSADACSEELLLAARPDYAVISTGYHPWLSTSDETLERLSAAGCAIYRTDWQGTVTITKQ